MALPEDLVEEFLLRLPPSEPASLVRAALVCKLWCGLISSPRFRRRFHEFHRTPPMLGFIRNTREGFGPYVARFITTSSFRLPRADNRDWLALDAHHGRVLLRSMDSGHSNLIVWDPMTDQSWQLPRSAGTRLCSAPARLVAPATTSTVPTGTSSLSSRPTSSIRCPCGYTHRRLGSWSEPTPVPQCVVDEMPTALVGNTLYFSIDSCMRILSYDLSTRETSVICLPPISVEGATVLMTMEDGVLGAAREEGGTLSLWSMETSSNGDIGLGSAQIRVIELHKLLPVKTLIFFTKIVFAPGIGVFFVSGDGGLFTVGLKSDLVKKEFDNDENHVVSIVPYMSFYTLDFELLTGVGSRADVSST